MAIVPIREAGDPVLHQKAEPVPARLFGSDELRQIITDMADTMDAESDGVAIAAPQIGIPYRIFLVRYDRMTAPPEGEPQPAAELGIFVNPEIVKLSQKSEVMDEGCLSVRGKYGKTQRKVRATVRAYDADGKKFERGGGGVLAQAYQHEMDHLEGILFTDHAKDVIDVRRVKTEHTVSTTPFAFFGTPYVASDTLAILLEKGFRPEVVITSPDAPRGRGMVMTACETKQLALENGLPVLTPEKLDDAAVAEIAAYGCEYAVVVAYGKIFPESLIAAFPLGAINVHYSLLPKWRGASPVESALLAGDEVTGVAIQKLVKEMDAGDILAMQEVAIEPTETTAELRPRLVELGAHMLVNLLPKFETGTVTPVAQNTALATRSRKIAKADGELDLGGDALLNWRKYRAYAEGPGTYFFRDGKRVKIISAQFKNGAFTPLRVVPEGKKEMAYADLVR